MKYLYCRQIWRDAFTPMGFHGVDTFLDPKARGEMKAGQVYAKQTRSTKGNDDQIFNSWLMGRAQDIIAGLDPINRAWGMFAYAPDFQEEDRRAVQEYLYQEWWQGYGEKKISCSFRQMSRLILCFNEALEGVKHTNMTGQPISIRQISNRIGVDPGNFDRDGWLRRFGQMEQIIDTVDIAALSPLNVLLDNS